MTAALALDLGTTRIKLGALDDDGRLGEVQALPAPRPAGADPLVRELDADEYRRGAEALLAKTPAGLPLGIASQRSSFLLWDASGKPATPLISWQDRSAQAWCQRHIERGPELAGRTGLVLSPHYAGPKLAALFERDQDLARRCASGELRFGTLESYLIWHWSEGAVHETDLSMAARTLLVELGSNPSSGASPGASEFKAGAWSDELCELFGVPPAALGTIAPSIGRSTPLRRHTLTASVADQPASLVASLGADAGGVLCNLGTGVFCLLPTGRELDRRGGYLTGPLLGDDQGALWALEGTINGGGATADRCAPGPTQLTATDPQPELFCLPDENGIGAPHWRAEQGLTFSREVADPAAQRQAVLEGLLFRVHAILDDFADDFGDGFNDTDEPVSISGGLANEPFVPSALAATLGRPVQVLEEEEATLLGAARLAAGFGPGLSAPPRSRMVEPPPEGAWLSTKSFLWRRWVADLIG